MWDVKAGDLVVCIDVSEPGRAWPQGGLALSRVYTVQRIEPALSRAGRPRRTYVWLFLEEISRPFDTKHNRAVGYASRRFRKVNPVRQELFESLIKPQQELV